MGHQARLKRERRAERMRSPARPARRRGGLALVVATASVVALAAALAVVLGRDDAGPAGEAEAASVRVEGAPLPTLDDVSADAAVGQPAPGLVGTGADGGQLSIPATDRPRVLIFLAHWCPHCQREVPAIVDWLRARGLPEGVGLYSVATATDPDRPNYPPTAWLQRERWQLPTLLDDEAGNAAAAYGVTGFPFFVFVDSDGTVVTRHAGELAIDDLARRIESIRG